MSLRSTLRQDATRCLLSGASFPHSKASVLSDISRITRQPETGLSSCQPQTRFISASIRLSLEEESYHVFDTWPLQLLMPDAICNPSCILMEDCCSCPCLPSGHTLLRTDLVQGSFVQPYTREWGRTPSSKDIASTGYPSLFLPPATADTTDSRSQRLFLIIISPNPQPRVP